ncbi:hypothetical protein [Enterococcus avium]|uniref:hypothetical protein n=1 Tax=Enterococcus avium TaxID=33945 RepID=UPI0028919971|nr:hypothetical protein [Enterococcus avium]MDT2565157.1 hypothetical protein [Enterococcus avium]
MNTRDKIHSAINEHIEVDDTYAYFLTREKSSFSVGTVTLDDFEEWTDSDVADLTDSIMEKINTELNENQQVVLEWLKKSHQIGWHVLELFDTLLNRNYAGFGKKGHSKIDKVRSSILALDESEMFQILAAFAEWGMKNVQED